MKTALLAAALITTSASAASAGTYLGLGIGPGVETSGDVSFQPDGRLGKLLLGVSFGRFAIEGSGTRFGLVQAGGRRYETTQLALSGKLSLPLSSGFEAFGHLGMQRTSLSATDGSGVDGQGSGITFGAGVEYRLDLVATQASLFLDYSLSNLTLSGPSFNDQGVTSRMWILGVTIGI